MMTTTATEEPAAETLETDMKKDEAISTINLDQIGDEELRQRLLAAGENVGPLIPSTKPFLIKKLARILGKGTDDTSTSVEDKDAKLCSGQCNKSALAESEHCSILPGKEDVLLTGSGCLNHPEIEATNLSLPLPTDTDNKNETDTSCKSSVFYGVCLPPEEHSSKNPEDGISLSSSTLKCVNPSITNHIFK